MGTVLTNCVNGNWPLFKKLTGTRGGVGLWNLSKRLIGERNQHLCNISERKIGPVATIRTDNLARNFILLPCRVPPMSLNAHWQQEVGVSSDVRKLRIVQLYDFQ